MTVVFLLVTIFILLAPQLSDGKISPTELFYPYSALTSSVCCGLSGLGVVIGIVLLLVAGRSDSSAS